jgi:Galactose mutarotase and related enzymes
MDLKYVYLENADGASVKLCNLGASVVNIYVPDRNLHYEDVLLGPDPNCPPPFGGAYFGKTVGRYANRIAHGRFSLPEGSEDYVLACNNGAHHLHGGINGLSEVLWTPSEPEQLENGSQCVRYRYTSPNGEEGYPGHLELEVVYRWGPKACLRMDFYAHTDKATVINLSNHCYFNLEGQGREGAMNQRLQLCASHYLPVDTGLIPTGVLAPVAGGAMDFRQPKALGRDIDAADVQLQSGGGYDHCFVLDTASAFYEGCGLAAVLEAPESGRRLKIFTNQPGVQLYSGNFLADAGSGKSGQAYANRSGVALECQNFPDAPHHAHFPSPWLRPGEAYHKTIIYLFSHE